MAISGELDHTTAPVLPAAVQSLLDNGAQEIHLDLAGLDFCDSSGFNAFITAHNASHDHDSAARVLVKPNRLIQALLQTTGLTSQFDIR